MLATSLTYLVHWARTPDGLRYHGCDFTNLGDIYAHVTWMTQAAQGHQLFIVLYDAAPQQRTLFHPYFLLLGVAARATHLDPIVAIHLARVAASVALLVVVRGFVREQLPPGSIRTRAFLLLSLGTGLPGLLPEASPVSTMLDSELHTTAWVMLLLALRGWMASERSGELGGAARAGLLGALLAFIHPYEALSIIAIVGALTVVRERGAGERTLVPRLLLALGPTVAASAAVALSVRANPVMEAWARHPQPTESWNLLAFGTLWGLGLCGLLWPPRGAVVDRRLVVWLATGLALMIAPLPAQRRFILGLQAPLAVLAALGFDGLLERGRWARLAARALLVGAFPVAALLVLLDLTDLVPTPRYIPAAIIADCKTLEELPSGPLFTSPGLGYFVAAFSGHQVNAGHVHMTSELEERKREWSRFEAGELDGAWLAGRGYRFVVLGPTVVDRGWSGLRPYRELERLKVLEVISSAPSSGAR